MLLVSLVTWNAHIGVSFGASGLTAGIPALPCAEIIERKDDVQMQDWINFWIKGFWTGQNWANHLGKKPLKNLSETTVKPAALKARVVAYCYENPKAILMQVAIQFFEKLPDLPDDVRFEERIAP